MVLMLLNIALILAITFFMSLWHSIALETSSITNLTTSDIQNTVVVVVNQSYFYFPVVICTTGWTRYYETLLHSFVNLENIVLLIIVFLEGHSDSRTIHTLTFWYGCELYTFDIQLFLIRLYHLLCIIYKYMVSIIFIASDNLFKLCHRHIIFISDFSL